MTSARATAALLAAATTLSLGPPAGASLYDVYGFGTLNADKDTVYKHNCKVVSFELRMRHSIDNPSKPVKF